MKTIGLFKAMRLCREYPKMNEGCRDALRGERLAKLVKYARKKSPYYADLYSGLPENVRLDMLPPVSKPELMAHWDEWVTDRSVKLEEVNEFMRDRDNLGRKLRGKYQVYTTSGSTGNPLVMLCDKTTANVTNGISFCRAYARDEDMKSFITR